MTDPARQTVLLFGSGRSGTTWVQDTLAEANDCATLFEPLLPEAVPGARPFANLYVPAQESNAELQAFLSDMFSRRHAGLWPELRVRPDRLFPGLNTLLSVRGIKDTAVQYRQAFSRWKKHRHKVGTPRIIKFIRGNLMAHWMQHKFGFASAAIVRHPCAVLASVNKRLGREWTIDAMRENLDRYLAQERLVEDRLKGMVNELKSLETMAEIHTAIWCIENSQFFGEGNNGLYVAHYEELVERQTGAWEDLKNALGLPRIPDDDILERPSQQASYRMGPKASAEKLLHAWRTELTDEDVEQVQRVLDIFGVTRYTVESYRPGNG